MEMTAVDQLAESAECLLREIRYSATLSRREYLSLAGPCRDCVRAIQEEVMTVFGGGSGD
jgi:hypothetical protein